MTRYFISQPMQGLSDKAIHEERNAIMDMILAYDPEADITPLINREIIKEFPPLTSLGLSIADLGKCDVAIFAADWWESRGCFLEHACCQEYGIPHVDLVIKATDTESRANDILIKRAIRNAKKGISDDLLA